MNIARKLKHTFAAALDHYESDVWKYIGMNFVALIFLIICGIVASLITIMLTEGLLGIHTSRFDTDFPSLVASSNLFSVLILLPYSNLFLRKNWGENGPSGLQLFESNGRAIWLQFLLFIGIYIFLAVAASWINSELNYYGLFQPVMSVFLNLIPLAFVVHSLSKVNGRSREFFWKKFLVTIIFCTAIYGVLLCFQNFLGYTLQYFITDLFGNSLFQMVFGIFLQLMIYSFFLTAFGAGIAAVVGIEREDPEV